MTTLIFYRKHDNDWPVFKTILQSVLSYSAWLSSKGNIGRNFDDRNIIFFNYGSPTMLMAFSC